MIKARYKTYRLEGFIVSCGTCGYKSVIYIRTFLREWGFAVNFMTVAPSIDTKLNIRHLILLGSIIYGAIHGRTRLLCNKNQWLWLIGMLACYASFRPVTEGTNPFIARNTTLTFNFQAWGCIWPNLIWSVVTCSCDWLNPAIRYYRFLFARPLSTVQPTQRS